MSFNQSEAISSIMAELEMGKNIHFKSIFFPISTVAIIQEMTSGTNNIIVWNTVTKKYYLANIWTKKYWFSCLKNKIRWRNTKTILSSCALILDRPFLGVTIVLVCNCLFCVTNPRIHNYLLCSCVAFIFKNVIYYVDLSSKNL